MKYFMNSILNKVKEMEKGVKTPSKHIGIERLEQIKRDNFIGESGKEYDEEETNKAIIERKNSNAEKQPSFPEIESDKNRQDYSWIFNNGLKKTKSQFGAFTSLIKGAMNRLYPVKGSKEVPAGIKEEMRSWQTASRHGSRENLGQMGLPPDYRARALHGLHKETQVRKAPDGKREFLMHRAMSADEAKESVSGNTINHSSSHSSWTPDYNMASGFIGMEEDGLNPDFKPYGGVQSAWIHEDNIVHKPSQLGSYRKKAIKGPLFNEMKHEKEYIIKPNHNSKRVDYRNSSSNDIDTKINTRSNMAASEGKIDDLQKMSRPRITFPHFGTNSRPDQQVQPISTPRQEDIYSRKVANREVASYEKDRNKKLSPKARQGNIDRLAAENKKDFSHAYGLSHNINQDPTAGAKTYSTNVNKKPAYLTNPKQEVRHANRENIAAHGKRFNATVEHEGLHYNLDLIRNKYGEGAHKKLVNGVLNHFGKDIKLAVGKWLTENYDYDSNSPNYNEEMVTNIRDILTNPAKRQNFAEHLDLDPESMNALTSDIKSSYQKAYEWSQKVTPKTLSSKRKVNKSEDLEKGSLQSRNKVDPRLDVGTAEEMDLWQNDYDQEGRTNLSNTGMDANSRFRALHKLTGKTPVKKGPDGKRMFLLHRGMSADEFNGNKHANEAGNPTLNHDEATSWTPDLELAYDFGHHEDEEGNARNHGVASGWVHEDNISFIPNQYGDGYGTGENAYRAEQEIIVKPKHQTELVNKKGVKELLGMSDKGTRYAPSSLDQLISLRGQNGPVKGITAQYHKRRKK